MGDFEAGFFCVALVVAGAIVGGVVGYREGLSSGCHDGIPDPSCSTGATLQVESGVAVCKCPKEVKP
jgi:hypothetical protein